MMLQQAEYDARKAAEKLTGDNISDKTKRYQLKLVHEELRQIIKGMYKDLVPVIAAGQQDAAEAAAKAALANDAEVLKALFPNPADRKAWKASFIQTARHGIASMVMRINKTNIPLSKRVYKSSAWTNHQLDRIINSHLARGSSAKALAKDVQKFVNPKTPGGVKYASMRLARTEINNAFHAMEIDAAQEFPWCEEVEWHLSKSHPLLQRCKCEVYAAQGTFPKDAVPLKPHPQCLCYIVPKTMEWDDFANQLESGGFDDFFESKYGMPAA